MSTPKWINDIKASSIFFCAGFFYILISCITFFVDTPNNLTIPLTTTCGVLFFNLAIQMRNCPLPLRNRVWGMVKGIVFIVCPLCVYALISIILLICKNVRPSCFLQLFMQILLPAITSILFSIGLDTSDIR